jgi:RNA polymerase sigma factor (sigma-70 family)
MNYDTIENLAVQAKLGDTKAKESLVKEFAPLILKLSKRSFINSYEFEDIKNECYKTLFKCVNMYNPDKHRFVAYATNAIKNSVYHLIRTSIRRSGVEGSAALILDGNFDHTLYAEPDKLDDILIGGINKSKLQAGIKNLTLSDREFINYIYFKGFSLRRYSELKGVPYTTVVSRKTSILNKLKKNIQTSTKTNYRLN